MILKQYFMQEPLPSRSVHIRWAFDAVSFEIYWSLAALFAVTVGFLAKDNSLRSYEIRICPQLSENQFGKAKFRIRECPFTFFEHREYRRWRRKYRGRFLTIWLVEVWSKPLETVSNFGSIGVLSECFSI